METKSTEILTEVTSIAAEDEKTGMTTAIPPPEELVSKAAISMYVSRQQLIPLMGNMSKKATLRVLNAIFELPQDNLPVFLKTDEEKRAFVLGQKILMDRFLIIQHSINKEIQSRKLKEQEQNNE
ncbi:MAG: hypothetical protein RIR48_2890 [Bacteroidota bacterium]|jgi:hypothetical protein